MKDYSVLENIKKDNGECISRAFDMGYQQGISDGNINDGTFARKVKESYGNGLNDAWECAKKIILHFDNGGMPSTEINAVFGLNPHGVMLDYTASEAIEKIKAWEQKKEQPKCELANCICPYYGIDCAECEVFCSVERARQRAKEKE